MKLAILSDLHLDINDLIPEKLGIDLTVDIVIVAGDVHSNISHNEKFLKRIEILSKCPVIFVPGNHDYYNNFRNPEISSGTLTINGKILAWATLWTHLSSSEWYLYKYGLNDTRFIRDWTYDRYDSIHKNQKRFLLESGADIIISHHAPSWQSVSPNYYGDPLNCAFLNNMDDEILALKKPPQIWIHGHIHTSHDYLIGNTRIICHPREYDWESEYIGYRAKIVEI